jgi:hypothetical protein
MAGKAVTRPARALASGILNMIEGRAKKRKKAKTKAGAMDDDAKRRIKERKEIIKKYK